MKYPSTQTPMTTNFDSYMDMNRFPKFEDSKGQDSIELERRRTSLQQTYDFIRRKFGKRKFVNH